MSSLTRTRRTQILALTVALFIVTVALAGWRAQALHGTFTAASNGLTAAKAYVLAGAVPVVAPSPAPMFATLTVTNTNDSGAGSLRNTIAAAVAGDTIDFAVTGTITLTSGELLINKNLTIQGPGANQLTISGNNASRVFNISSGSIVTLSGMTISNGRAVDGGGINNSGTLTILNSTISGNTVTGGNNNRGGGIFSAGPLTLTNCTISGNMATGTDDNQFGGGIYQNGTGIFTNCTISGNMVRGNGSSDFNFGGGIYYQGGTINLTNCTITANSLTGGATCRGGGIISGSNNVTLRNTIFTGNTVSGAQSLGPDILGAVNSLGFNLIGNTADATINGDATGNLLNVNPQLGPLTNNGGPTQTHALLSNSPALNAGSNALALDANNQPLTTDQRGTGFPRRSGVNVEIGAFEFQCQSITVTNPATSTSLAGAAFSQTFAQMGGSGTVNFSTTSALPTGLTLSSAGLLSGTPTQAGTFPIVVRATDQNGCFGDGATYTLTITCPTITVGTPTATGALGVAYSSSAAATPAVSAPQNYRYSLANSTTLPNGLSLNPNTGAITGTPTATGNVSFDLKAELFNDNTATGCAVTVQRSINIACVTDPVVTTNADSGTGSLREAIAIACPGSTITFANGVNLITLTTGQLAVNKNLTFQGPGANLLTISGNNASRVFDIGFGITVNFNDLTIANGNTTNPGGGIQTIYSASTVSLTNCTLTNNTTTNSGGGIYSNGGPLTLTNCTLTNNTTTNNGGGIYSSGSGKLTITGSTITNNSATGSFSSGGGIYQSSSQGMTITGSTISGNSAGNQGGGISNSLGTLTITDSTITGNSITGGFSNGGGIYDGSSEGMTVTNTTISGNSSAYIGGGIANSGGPATITGCTIANNSSGGSNGGVGGGIYHQSSNAMTISGSTISGNRLNGNSFANGGGLSISGLATLINSTIVGNTVNGSGLNRGGGLYADSRSNLVNCTVVGNVVSGGTSNQGGGIYNGSQSNVRNTIIAGNSAATGPDVFNSSSPFTSQGHNLIGKGDGSTGFTNGVNNDQVGSIATPLDAMLALLGNYGGPTQTMRPLIGSPAIDAGGLVSEIQQILVSGVSGDYTLTFDGQTTGNLAWNASQVDVQTALEGLSNIGAGNVVVEGCCRVYTVFFRGTLANSNQPQLTANGTATVSIQTFLDGGPLATDQRSFARPQGSAVDIGTVEVNYALAATSGTPQSTTVNTAFANPLVATLTESGNPVSSVLLTFTAPVSGPSATFPNGNTATTNASGQASVNVAANTTTGGAYTVTANTTPGLTTPASFNLTNTCPVIATPTINGNLSFCANGSTTLTATGAGTFMWFKDNTLITGQTANRLTVTEAGSYTVKVTDANNCASATSQPAVVTVYANPVSIIDGPTEVCANATGISFSGNGGASSYKWEITDGSGSIVGSTTNQFVNVTAGASGSFTLKLTLSNGFGCFASTTKMVTINPLTTTTALTTQTVCQGSNVTFTTTASGTGPFSFGWKKGATTISTGISAMGNTSTLTLNNVQPGEAGSYSVEVTGTCGTATQNATLTVNTPPSVTTNPQPLNLNPGDLATFTAAASGTPTPTVQWQVSTDTGMSFTDLPGAQNTTLSFTTMASQNGYLYRAVFTNSCGTVNTTAALLTLCTPPTMTLQPVNQIVGQNATATFTADASGSPAPTVQWQVDTGTGFNDIPGATNATLTVPNITLEMNGFQYRAVFTNDCGSVNSDAARLTVNGLKVQIGDPLLCLNAGGLVGVTVTITNNNAALVNANFTATLPTTLNGLPGTGLSSIMPGAVTVTAAAVTWMGVIPANTTVTILYKAQVAAGTPANMPICVDSEVTFNGGPKATVQECQVLNCPANGVVKVSDQKPGALLVFPYYISKAAEKKDTRLTISNISDKPISAHVFFIDGATCQQADQFLCLTPFASFTFKASEYDPEATGWLLVVAVDANGRPTQQNGLIGNAFVNDGEYVDNYGAEAFKANSPLLATTTTDTATLFFDNQSYDAVPNQFAMEIQSPLDAPNQRVVTVGLQGDLTQSTVRGAAQIGPGLVINGNEKPLGSFVSWLNGNCQAQATINANSPRVPGTMNGMIPKGQVGTMQFKIGAGVGLLMTTRTATWPGLRTLHKVGSTATSLTIPLIAPVC